MIRDRLRRSWLNPGGAARLPMIRQSTASECALACIAMLASHFGAASDLSYLRRRHPLSARGASLASVAATCRELGLSTRAVRCGMAELRQLRLPCILHWRFNHFVVLKSLRRQALVLHDPARGVVVETQLAAAEAFTGVALEVSPTQRFKPRQVCRQLRLADLVAGGAAAGRTFAAGLFLALVCEALLLGAPLFLQIVIDEVLVKDDPALLLTLVVAFTGLLSIQLAANVLRQLTFQYLGQAAVFESAGRLVHHLLSRPLGFFRSRELRALQHRVQSLARIQEFLVRAVPQLILDLVFATLTTVLLLIYDVRLTLVVIAALALWSAWRLVILPRSLRLTSDIAQAEAALQTHFLESLRTMQTVKIANGEAHRESAWRNLMADACNLRLRAGNLQIVDGVVRQLTFQGLRILVIYQLALLGLAGGLSIGMISAFVTYLGMFTTRGGGIVDRLLEYKLLDVPLQRLADIVFAAGEAPVDGAGDGDIGDIELDSVSFRFGRHEPEILCNCSARIERGRLTAIAGPSGVGKSTLLQIIAGVEPAAHGSVRISGKPVEHWQGRALRAQMAVVLQGDVLLKGSIAENIALFDTQIDRRRIKQAAAEACIADEIDALPMAYETRIGDLGSSLSRGQVQRLLLARAFYRRPALMLLDEVTSGLDRDLERAVVRSLGRQDATRIVVTHSDLMLQAADTVLWLHEGRLLSSRPDLSVWGPR